MIGRVGGVGQADLGEADAPAARAGWSVGAQRGKKPSSRTRSSVSRVSSVLTEPPMTFEPRPRTVTGAALFLGSAKRVSLAFRQA